MIGTTKFGRHTDLVKRMAEAVGADLPRALSDGALTPEGLRGAVVACTGCTCPDACGDWLDRTGTGAEAGSTAPPGYCRNAELWARLADRPAS
jgi:hypothetical protein